MRVSGRVLVVVDDLLFVSKIDGAAAALGLSWEAVPSPDALTQHTRAARPAVVIVNLTHRRFDALAALESLKADPAMADLPVLAYGPHTDTVRLARANALPAVRAVSRSEFSARLQTLLRAALESPTS